jgi:hypothetical protein
VSVERIREIRHIDLISLLCEFFCKFYLPFFLFFSYGKRFNIPIHQGRCDEFSIFRLICKYLPTMDENISVHKQKVRIYRYFLLVFHRETIRILEIVEYDLLMPSRCIGRDLIRGKVSHLTTLARTDCLTARDLTDKRKQYFFVIGLVVDARELDDTDLESGFLVRLSPDSFPRGLARIESSTR